MQFNGIERMRNEQREKRMKENEQSLRILWDTFKHSNIHIMGVPEGRDREIGRERIFEEVMIQNTQM